MPHDVYLQVNADVGGPPFSFRCEVWVDPYTNEGIVSVEGRSLEDRSRLAKHRTQIAAALVAEHGLEKARFFEGRWDGRCAEVRLGIDGNGRVASTTETENTLTRSEVAAEGDRLLDQEVRYRKSMSPYPPGRMGHGPSP